MSDDVMPCEHGSYGLCPQCVRDERDSLRAELESLLEMNGTQAQTIVSMRREINELTDSLTHPSYEVENRLRAELAESRRLLDEVRSTLIGIAGATARAWELPRNEFIDEFLPWAQSRARDAVEKMKAAPVPAQPDDVAKDAARYRWMRADGPNTYMTLKETAHLIGDAYDAAIDAAILSATDSEVKK